MIPPQHGAVADTLALRALDAVTAAFAGWTAGYGLVLATRLPAWTMVPAALAFAVPFLRLALRHRPALVRHSGPATVAALLLIALGMAFPLSFYRPDLDDVSFLHRAVHLAEHPDQPVAIVDHLLDRPLPLMSAHHVLTSYEPLIALTARALGLDALRTYHTLGAAVAGALWVLVYLALFRQLGQGPWPARIGTASAMAFLLLEGGAQYRFGPFAFVRLWHGKAILLTVLVPFALLAAWRFLDAPSRRRGARVAGIAIAGVGLSSSAIFLLPTLAGAAALTHVAMRRDRKALRTSLGLMGTMAPCLLLALALATGILPRPADSSVWQQGFPSHWGANLMLVVGRTADLARNLVWLLAVPFVALGMRRATPVVGLSVVLLLGFAQPLTGPLALRLIEPGAFWRLALLFPLPLAAGLLGIAAARVTRDRDAKRHRAGRGHRHPAARPRPRDHRVSRHRAAPPDALCRSGGIQSPPRYPRLPRRRPTPPRGAHPARPVRGLVDRARGAERPAAGSTAVPATPRLRQRRRSRHRRAAQPGSGAGCRQAGDTGAGRRLSHRRRFG